VNRRRFLVTTGVTALAAGPCVAYWPERWDYIVVRHSAGDYGTVKFLQDVHQERQPADPADAIPYHYVIGNGLGMGPVASDWRRDWNICGAHASANNRPRNLLGLGICLIGNLDSAPPPKPQFDALVALMRRLMHRYAIAAENVGTHGRTVGESTRCPGR